MESLSFIGISLLIPIVQIAATEQYEGCGGKPADIVFVLDSSSSIPFKDFLKELNFTKNVVDLFDIGEDKTRVGLISFSTSVKPEIGLGQYNSKDDLIENIKRVQFLGGNTNTGEALAYVKTKAFPDKQANRPRIAIVLTDGQSNNVESTVTEANAAKAEGITVFVIGIGFQVDEKELESIASRPLSTYMFKIGSFDALDSIKSELAINTCKVPPVTLPPPTEPMMNDDAVLYGEGSCHPSKPTSVAFAVDTSSIGSENAYFVMMLTNRIASRLEMNQQRVSMSVLTGSCGQHSSGSAIDHAQDPGKLRYGLEMMTSNSFQGLFRDMRMNIQNDRTVKVGFIFLSRQLSKDEYHKAELESRRSKFKKIHIFVIGVGFNVDESQAFGLTMEKDHYMHTDKYETLYELEGPILYRICRVE